MSIAADYEVIEVVSSDLVVRVEIPWPYDSVSQLFVLVQDSITGVVQTFEAGEFTVVEKSDISGDYIEVENNTGNPVIVSTARRTAQTQTYKLKDSEALNPVAFVESLDKAIKLIQEIAEGFSYSSQNITSVNPFVFPDFVTRANAIVGFDENGDLDLSVSLDDVRQIINADIGALFAARLDELTPQAFADFASTMRIGALRTESLTSVSSQIVLAENPLGDVAVFAVHGGVQEEVTNWTITGQVIDLSAGGYPDGTEFFCVYTVLDTDGNGNPQNTPISEEITLTGNSLELSQTPLSGPTVYVYWGGVLRRNAGYVLSDADYSLSGKTLTLTAGSDIPDGSTIIINYHK